MRTRSFLALERSQYRGRRSLVVAISEMVRRHFEHYYGLSADDLIVVSDTAELRDGDRVQPREVTR